MENPAWKKTLSDRYEGMNANVKEKIIEKKHPMIPCRAQTLAQSEFEYGLAFLNYLWGAGFNLPDPVIGLKVGTSL